MRRLYLKENAITALPAGTFWNLASLYYMCVARARDAPCVFNAAVRSDLSVNQISSISPSAFSGMTPSTFEYLCDARAARLRLAVSVNA